MDLRHGQWQNPVKVCTELRSANVLIIVCRKQDERKTLTTQSMASATKVVAERTRDVGNIVFL